jgi:protein CMS1
MMTQRGDDLDDDFVPDDLVALSDGAVSDPGDDVQDLLSGDEEAEGGGADEKLTSDKERKRKRREKEKERKAKVCAISKQRDI